MEFAQRLDFDFEDGRLLLCSDGIMECHYRSPQTSISPAHLRELDQPGVSSREFVEKLVQMALRGVDGNPGGQDNIVVISAEAKA